MQFTKNMTRTLFIFGGSSTALEIEETAGLLIGAQFSSVKLVVPSDEDPDGDSRIDIELLDDHLNDAAGDGFVLSMSNQSVRANCLKVAQRLGLQPASVIHPRAYVSPSAIVGCGVYAAAHSVISTQVTIEDHVLINYHVTVGHHSHIGQHSVLNPGARISGNVRVGHRVLVGSNAFIFQGKSIGDDTLIDAMTYVDRDIDSEQLCTSRQLKVVKRRFT